MPDDPRYAPYGQSLLHRVLPPAALEELDRKLKEEEARSDAFFALLADPHQPERRLKARRS